VVEIDARPGLVDRGCEAPDEARVAGGNVAEASVLAGDVDADGRASAEQLAEAMTMATARPTVWRGNRPTPPCTCLPRPAVNATPTAGRRGTA
jgi:hypothetical protein